MKHKLFELGYTKGETLTIGDVAYEVDETGNINLPKDAAVFLDYNVDQTYLNRQRITTIKHELVKMGGTGKVLSTPTFNYTLDKDDHLVETKR